MAWVELRPSGKYTYAVVVEEQRDGEGRTRRRVVRSFGNANEAHNVQQAHKFAAAYNAGRVMLGAFTEDEVRRFVTTVFVGALAIGVLAALFGDEGDDDEDEEE